MPPVVLAVEDDATQRLVLEWELERLATEGGFESQVAPDVASAQRVLRAHPPEDVYVLCDANLPDGSGADLVRAHHQRGGEGVLLSAAPLDVPGIEVHTKPSSLDAQRRWLRERLTEAGVLSTQTPAGRN